SGPDAFVVRLKPQGAIDYATYLGGSSQAWSDGIVVDALGAAFIIGATNSAKFPVTPGAYLAASGIPNFSASSFLARLSPDGSALIYSTFTDAQSDHDAAVAVDSADNAVVLPSKKDETRSGFLQFRPLLLAAAGRRSPANRTGTRVRSADDLPGGFNPGGAQVPVLPKDVGAGSGGRPHGPGVFGALP